MTLSLRSPEKLESSRGQLEQISRSFTQRISAASAESTSALPWPAGGSSLEEVLGSDLTNLEPSSSLMSCQTRERISISLPCTMSEAPMFWKLQPSAVL